MNGEELVAYRLEMIDKRLGRMEEKQSELQVTVAGLKVKAGVWGAIAGALGAAIAVLLSMFGGKG